MENAGTRQGKTARTAARSFVARWLAAALLFSVFAGMGADRAHAIAFEHGPYLTDMTETAVTILWYTDVDSTGTVEYGTGGTYPNSVTEKKRAHVTVGKRHEVRLTGLTPGTTYNYRVKSTEVTSLVGYSISLGSTTTGSGHTFTTFDDSVTDFTFWFLSDTHSNATRMNTSLALIDAGDFVVFGGDIIENPETETPIFSTFIDPAVNYFATEQPIVYSRGNHELIGSFSRELYPYFRTDGLEWYYAFNHGPAAFVNFDSGLDVSDTSPYTQGLMSSDPYLAEQYAWLDEYKDEPAFSNAVMKIAFSHIPFVALINRPSLNRQQWMDLNNEAGFHLMLSGHVHSYNHYRPGEFGNNFHAFTVGQGNIAKVRVTTTQIQVTVYDNTGAVVDSFNVDPAVTIPQTMFSFSGGASLAVGQPLELGTVFEPAVDGEITAVRVFGVVNESGDHTVRIWRNSDNSVVAGPYTFNFTGLGTWSTYYLPTPLAVDANTEYTVSVSTGTDTYKYYGYVPGGLPGAGDNGGDLTWPANAGVYTLSMGTRPATPYMGTNYLRDVIFVPD